VGLIVAIMPHMVHSASVSFPETFAEFPAVVSVDGWVFIHFVVIGIGVATFAHVMPGGFNTFVKAAALSITVFGWRLFPAVVIVVLGEGCIGGGLRFKSVCLERA
jgi:hypothetical protein